MPTTIPFPGNPNVTGSNMPAGLAMPPPRSGGPGAMPGSTIGGGGGWVVDGPAGADSPTPRQTFATPPGGMPQQAAPVGPPPPALLSPDQVMQGAQAAASIGAAIPPSMVTGGPAWTPAMGGVRGYGDGAGGQVPTTPAAPPAQPPAVPPTGLPWYFRYPIGAYLIASRVPKWMWFAGGVALGAGIAVEVQRRRRVRRRVVTTAEEE